VSFLERIRRFWSSAPPPDHPLSEHERDEERRSSAADEKAHQEMESLAGGDFDSDDDPTARY
jgi:hypothetical protein